MLFFPTVDEDVAYFRSQGYTGSLNDMHYKAMGDLGYTGSLSDRIHAFLVSEYGSFYEAMRDLRNSSASFVALRYGVDTKQPALVFDFVGNYFRKGGAKSTITEALVHTRASSATMVNSSGALVTVGNNVPRTGHHVYNGSEWVNEGLLLESEARTNLRTYSADLSISGFSANGAVLTGSQLDPNGGNTGWTVSGMTTSNQYRAINGSGAVAAGDTLTGSIWIKGVAGETTQIIVTRGGTGTFEFTRKEITLTGNWQREHVTHTFVNSQQNSRLDVGKITSAPTAQSVSIAWAQIEHGSTPSSYIPTAGATVTRAAETLTVPAANMPWPKPVVIGPELITNGTFDTDISSWQDTSDAGGSISWNSSGYMDIVKVTGNARARQFVDVVQGKTYVFSIEIINSPTSGTIDINGTVVGRLATLGTGRHEIVHTYTGSSGSKSVEIKSFSGTAQVDNISVKEVNPLALSIQMDGRMTFADTDVYVLVQLHWWQLDTNNNIRKNIDGFGTDIGKPVTTMTALGVADYSIGDVDHYSPGVNVPFNYADRYGSTFVNSALEGTALTANTTPVGLPDLQNTDLTLGRKFMGTIGGFRVWADDIGDTGIAEAST